MSRGAGDAAFLLSDSSATGLRVSVTSERLKTKKLSFICMDVKKFEDGLRYLVAAC